MYGARIRQLRKERGLTMKQLGKRLDLAESTISGYENELRRPDIDQLVRFADLFDVSVDYLIGRSLVRQSLLSEANHAFESAQPYNVAILDGNVDLLTEEESQHVKNSLEMFRLWKAKHRKD